MYTHLSASFVHYSLRNNHTIVKQNTNEKAVKHTKTCSCFITQRGNDCKILAIEAMIRKHTVLVRTR